MKATFEEKTKWLRSAEKACQPTNSLPPGTCSTPVGQRSISSPVSESQTSGVL
jgi:hypothetical protein